MKFGDIVRSRNWPNDRWVVLGVTSGSGVISNCLFEIVHPGDGSDDLCFEAGHTIAMVLERDAHPVGYVDVFPASAPIELITDDPRYKESG